MHQILLDILASFLFLGEHCCSQMRNHAYCGGCGVGDATVVVVETGLRGCGRVSKLGARTSSCSNSEDGLAVDDVDDQVFLYSGSDVTVFAFAEVMNALQSANAASIKDMDRVCAVIKALLPQGEDLPSPRGLRALIHEKIPLVRRIHACVNDHVLFNNEHANLKRCPRCQTLRYFQSPTGHLIPVNVFRAIPLAAQIRRVYGNPTSARAMRLYKPPMPSDDTPVRDITESEGFGQVVFDSGFMDDPRNVVLLQGTDGGNPFARERVTNYALWPFLFYFLNMPARERYKLHNMVLGGLVSGHVYVNGVKKNRSVKNLNAYTN
jgi:hypothetical protein